MFISKKEKDLIQTRLNGYAKTMKDALLDIKMLQEKVLELEMKVNKKEATTEEKKAKRKEYMRQWHLRRKAEKLDFEFIQALAKEGKENVSS